MELCFYALERGCEWLLIMTQSIEHNIEEERHRRIETGRWLYELMPTVQGNSIRADQQEQRGDRNIDEYGGGRGGVMGSK